MKKGLLALAISAVSVGVFAEETSMLQNWESTTEVGFNMIDGNSDASNLIANIGVVNNAGLWKHAVNLNAYNATSEGTRTAERYKAGVGTNRDITDRLFATAFGQWEKDDFLAYDFQTVAGVGGGYHVYKQDDINLNFTAAPGYRHGEYKHTVDGPDEDEFVGIFGNHFDYKFSDTTKFVQDATVTTGEENTITDADVGLVTQLADNLSLKATYGIRHQAEAPAGFRNLDRRTGLTLLLNY